MTRFLVILATCALARGLAAPQEQQEPVAKFGTTVVIPDGLRGQIYHIKRESVRLPDFRKLKPVGTIYTTQLDIPTRSFNQGFPGVTKRFEWFAIEYTGRIWIQTAGVYRFSLLSDDGSKLFIDGRLVVDNDGIHAPQYLESMIDLEPGVHRMEVAYFQGPRFGVALVLQVASPGEDFRIFRVDDFKPPPGTELLVEPAQDLKTKK